MSMLGKTNKLEAVNQMLSFIGESPVNSLSDSAGAGDTPLAENVLDEVTREVLSQGWHFNTNYDVTHSPDPTTKEIILSESVLRIDVSLAAYPITDVVMRGQKLYNRAENSYEFTSDLKTIETIELPWDELPEQARRYITLRSARVLQDRTLGAPDLNEIGTREELVSLANLREFDEQSADYSIFDSHLPLKTISAYNRKS
jgi:hypothetical protein